MSNDTENISLILAALAETVNEVLGDNDDPPVAFLLIMNSEGITQCVGNTSQKGAAELVGSLLEHLKEDAKEDSPARPGTGPMNQ